MKALKPWTFLAILFGLLLVALAVIKQIPGLGKKSIVTQQKLVGLFHQIEAGDTREKIIQKGSGTGLVFGEQPLDVLYISPLFNLAGDNWRVIAEFGPDHLVTRKRIRMLDNDLIKPEGSPPDGEFNYPKP